MEAPAEYVNILTANSDSPNRNLDRARITEESSCWSTKPDARFFEHSI